MFDFSFLDPMMGADPMMNMFDATAAMPVPPMPPPVQPGMDYGPVLPPPGDLAAAWDAQAAAGNGAAPAAKGNPFGLSDKDWTTFYSGLRSLSTGGIGGATGAGGSMPNSSNYMRSGFAAPASAGGPNNLLLSLLQMHTNNQAAAGPSSRGRMSLLGG